MPENQDPTGCTHNKLVKRGLNDFCRVRQAGPGRIERLVRPGGQPRNLCGQCKHGRRNKTFRPSTHAKKPVDDASCDKDVQHAADLALALVPDEAASLKMRAAARNETNEHLRRWRLTATHRAMQARRPTATRLKTSERVQLLFSRFVHDLGRSLLDGNLLWTMQPMVPKPLAVRRISGWTCARASQHM